MLSFVLYFFSFNSSIQEEISILLHCINEILKLDVNK